MDLANGAANTTTPRLLITPRQAGATLAISERTLWSLTAPRGPIPAVRIGRAVRYDLADLRKWINQQKKTG